MSTPLHHVMVVGTGEPQDFQITDDLTTLDGTDWTIALRFTDGPDSPPTSVAWLDQDGGKVRVSGCEDMAVGRYLWRFKITDGSGNHAFAPSGKDANTWRVVRV